MAESYHRSWRAWRSRLKGDGVGFATESYAASALYTTLASLSGTLWRIRRARKREALTMDLIRPTFNPIAAFLRSSIAARSVRWDQAAFDDHRPALWGELRSGLAQARRR